jgi:hypothetical protein
MEPFQYFAVAMQLLEPPTSSVGVRRSVSTAYYGMFHRLNYEVAAIVRLEQSGRFLRAWHQAFRHLDHGQARRRCQDVWQKGHEFPAAIRDFSRLFCQMQDHRHSADYDPAVSFTEREAVALVVDVGAALKAFDEVAIEHRRVFATFLALRPSRD